MGWERQIAAGAGLFAGVGAMALTITPVLEKKYEQTDEIEVPWVKSQYSYGSMDHEPAVHGRLPEGYDDDHVELMSWDPKKGTAKVKAWRYTDFTGDERSAKVRQGVISGVASAVTAAGIVGGGLALRKRLPRAGTAMAFFGAAALATPAIIGATMGLGTLAGQAWKNATHSN